MKLDFTLTDKQRKEIIEMYRRFMKMASDDVASCAPDKRVGPQLHYAKWCDDCSTYHQVGAVPPEFVAAALDEAPDLIRDSTASLLLHRGAYPVDLVLLTMDARSTKYSSSDIPADMTADEYASTLDYYGSGSKRVLVVQLHTRAGTFVMVNEITTSESGKSSLQVMPMDFEKAIGGTTAPVFSAADSGETLQ